MADDHDQYRSGRRKKLAIIGVSSTLLVAMIVAVTVGFVVKGDDSRNNSKDKKPTDKFTAHTKAIKSICQPTDYKKECEKSLQSSAAKNTTDPKELVQIGFKTAMKYISEAANKSTTLRDLEQDPMAKKALHTCRELAAFAIQSLKDSFEKLETFDVYEVEELFGDLATWLTSTMTYQETCLDGFTDIDSQAGEKMREALKTGMHLSSNALAMITELTSWYGTNTENRRRLLSKNDDDTVPFHAETDDTPTWVNRKGRKLIDNFMKKMKPNVVVAKDGSGKFKTIGEAVKLVPRKNKTPFVIYIKEGVYNENVIIQKQQDHVVFIGDGPTKTKITGRLNRVDGVLTFKTGTVKVLGNYFMARDLHIENTAGPEKHQAVALMVSSDNSVFYNCRIDGYQDTLYAHANRQFYRNCTISGTIDFVFGNAAAIFQNCTFLFRTPGANSQQNILTAQGRTERKQASGIVLQNCKITADPAFYPVRNQYRSYLGRPWKMYSKTIIMESYMDDVIMPEGWMKWNESDFALSTLYYAEHKNWGPGSDKSSRVKWHGIKSITPQRAVDFTASSFLGGDTWIKRTGVPYTPLTFGNVGRTKV